MKTLLGYPIRPGDGSDMEKIKRQNRSLLQNI